jgi:hypothetical protein
LDSNLFSWQGEYGISPLSNKPSAQNKNNFQIEIFGKMLVNLVTNIPIIHRLPDKGFAIQQTKDGGFIAAGVRSRSHTVADLGVIKLDENGNLGEGKRPQTAPVPFQVKAGTQSPVQE